ncbi:BON domain-containing protein [Burkholderia singularis]|uniref:Osmotically inducible protein Y n=1 Tax=Burkholderia singularis TaxID=1503053 RepID=A0A238H3P3_9BURK|nr:BON domain-containing protein [Burkholderia singularis]SMF99936.1 Osmotically inducible protein Y precursor [Burkholderia singularis]
MKTDRQLKQDVQDELASDPAVDTALIDVEVAERIVKLSGHPTSYAQKLAVERAANRVAGVRAVVVEMIVRLPQDDARTDWDIADMARSILRWTVGLREEAVKVQVERGWVTLSGKVDWAYQRHVAVRAISQMRGVTGVTDHIDVLGSVDAEAIGENVKRAMLRHAAREATHIGVDVRDGMVTLSGKVDSYAEREVARGAAWSVRGVRAVIDNLVVG